MRVGRRVDEAGDAQPFVLHVAFGAHEVHGQAKRYGHLQGDRVVFFGVWAKVRAKAKVRHDQL
jgi:hypothetical protein